MKISIVTPSFNSALYIRETLQSVVSQQGDFTIEYFVVDNCSTDGTKEIIEDFQRTLANDSFPLGCNSVELNFISENDQGMYDAINKGLSKATGDVFAWINSDDIYLPGAFNTILKVFTKYPEFQWIKGITSYISSNSVIYQAGDCFLYSQEWISKGIYGRAHYFIQQDSVFWRRTLWNEVSAINHSLKLAGDYYLWVAFSKHAPLVSVKAYLSCFRSVEAQLSSNIAKYQKEMDEICPPNSKLEKLVRRFIENERKLPIRMRPFIYRILFGEQIYRAVIIDSNDVIQYLEGDYYSVSYKLL